LPWINRKETDFLNAIHLKMQSWICPRSRFFDHGSDRFLALGSSDGYMQVREPTASCPGKTQTARSLFEAEKDGQEGDAPGPGKSKKQETVASVGIEAMAAASHPDGDAVFIANAPRYLIVDGHSVIFAWSDLRKLQEKRSSLAREALIKHLRDYQDRTGARVVVVFDGKGTRVSETALPGDVHVFYSRRGQPADAIVERLASKYARRFDLTVATSDSLERETVNACGATSISPETLRSLVEEARRPRSKGRL
jgi:predicted RNA-binding protein with PIN domain